MNYMDMITSRTTVNARSQPRAFIMKCTLGTQTSRSLTKWLADLLMAAIIIMQRSIKIADSIAKVSLSTSPKAIRIQTYTETVTQRKHAFAKENENKVQVC